MSHIPNSAMPQANANSQETSQSDAMGETTNEGTGTVFSQFSGKIREYPKTAAAAGVVAAGLVAAATIPAIRGRGRTQNQKKTSSSKN